MFSLVLQKTRQFLIFSYASYCDGSEDKYDNHKRYHQQEPKRKTVTVNRLHHNHKIVHLVRHAEGYHNIAGREDPREYLREDLVDAELSELGFQQCKDLHKEIKHRLKNVELLVVSPMNRTIQTAFHSFHHLEGQIPWIAVEDIREVTGLHPCDRRLNISQHSQRYPFVDFGLIESDEDQLFPRYTGREPIEDVEKRAHQFLDWLKSRPEKEIIVVTHSAFLRYLFRNALEMDHVEFQNAEMRSFLINFDERGDHHRPHHQHHHDHDHASHQHEIQKDNSK